MSALFPRRDAGAARAFPLADGPRPSTGELIGAGFADAAVRTDSWSLTYRRRKEALDALAARLGPEGAAIRQEWERSAVLPDAAVDRLFARVRDAAARDPGSWGDAPQDRAALYGAIDADLKREVEQAGETLARGVGFGDAAAGFVGQIGGYGTSFNNLILALPGAGQASLARAALVEGGLGAVAEVTELPATVETEERLGLEPSDPLLQVAAGALFSAGLPVAGRGVRLAWKGARAVTNADLLAAARARVDALTPETRAAAAKLSAHERAMDADPAGDPAAHEGALGAADRALAAGDPALVPDRFDAASPDALAAPRRASLGERVRGVESGGRLDAQNPNSSALGPDQFIASTWLETVRRHAPQLTEGKTEAEILALRTDDRISAAMRDAHLRDLRADLGARGLPVHDGAVYLAYFAGPGGAARAFEAAPDAPIREVLSEAQIAANATVRHKGKALPDFTAQDLIDWAKAKMGVAPGAFTDLPMPSEIMSVRASEALTDAERFQYKLGGDAEGVTDRLLAETRWDPTAGIGLIFWERGDGRMFVGDGHQRAGLARRLEAQGHEPIDLQGFVFREADGWTPEAVRAVAALRNIRGETGTAADAAKFLRDYPELAGQVTRARDFMRRADALSRLAPDPFMAVINGAIPENFGAVIGRAAPGDERLQRAMLKAFRQLDPANETQADLIARDVRRMGLEREADAAQGDLFAEFDFGASAIGDRARVLDRALRDLKHDKAVFERLTREAERIEKEGNRLATDANARRAQLNQRIVQAVLYSADEPGPVRDALDAAAKSARGRGVAAAARDFAEAVRAGLERGDVGRAFDRSADGGAQAAGRAGGGEGRLAAEALDDPAPVRDAEAGETPRDLFADPAGPAARAEIETLEADLFGEPAAAARAANENVSVTQTGSRPRFVAVVDGIRRLAGLARAPGNPAGEKVAIAPVEDAFAAFLRAEHGLDVAGYVHDVDVSAIRHVIKQHGDPAREAARGQIAVADADFDAIPDILAGATHVVTGGRSKTGREIVGYVSALADGRVFYLEEVRTGRRTMSALTMRKFPAATSADVVADTLRSNARSDGGAAVKISRLPAEAKPVAPAAATNAPRTAARENPVPRPERLLDRMDPAEAELPVFLGEGAEARPLREVLQELDDDAEALAVLDLCAPRVAP